MQRLEEQEEIAEFEVGDLLGIGMTLVVLVIGLAYGLDVIGDVRDDMTDNSAEQNATIQGIDAISNIPARLGTVVTIIIAAVIIGVLVRYLWIRYK